MLLLSRISSSLFSRTMNLMILCNFVKIFNGWIREQNVFCSFWYLWWPRGAIVKLKSKKIKKKFNKKTKKKKKNKHETEKQKQKWKQNWKQKRKWKLKWKIKQKWKTNWKQKQKWELKWIVVIVFILFYTFVFIFLFVFAFSFSFLFCFWFLNVFVNSMWPRGAIDSQMSLNWPRSAIAFLLTPRSLEVP